MDCTSDAECVEKMNDGDAKCLYDDGQDNTCRELGTKFCATKNGPLGKVCPADGSPIRKGRARREIEAVFGRWFSRRDRS